MRHTCYTEYLCIPFHAEETAVQLSCAVIWFEYNAARRSRQICIELPSGRDPNAVIAPLKLFDECQSHNRVPRDRFGLRSCLSQ